MLLIMFVSLFIGVTAMGICSNLVFDKVLHVSPEEAEVKFARYSIYFNIVFVVSTIFSFFLLSRKIIRRLEVMDQNVEKIASGKMEELAKDKHKDEIGYLSNNINYMAEKIKSSIKKEQDMVCNIAHDLRTPITSISGYVELLEKDDSLSIDSRSYVEIISRKTKELSTQVNELLEYSVLQFKEKSYEMSELSLSMLLEQVLIDYIPVISDNDMEFSFKGNEKKCMFMCNQQLMIRLFENLISNSIRYGKDGKRLEIIIEERENGITIHFSNYGKSLTKEECDHIFDAFYQGSSAKQYKTESKGLGLAIVKKIVMIHNGTVFLECNNDKVTFTIEF